VPLALATAKEIEFTDRCSMRSTCELASPSCVRRHWPGFDIEAAHSHGVPGIGVTWGVGERRGLSDPD
jgi:hypothetical protein